MEAASAKISGAARAQTSVGAPHLTNLLRSDEKLVARYQEGDNAALSALYARYYGRVFAICLSVLSSRDDAQDAAQDVFLSVGSKLREGFSPKVFAHWLTRVARNAAIDFGRVRKTPVAEPAGYEPGSTALSPENVISRKDDVKNLLDGLNAIPEQQRSALVLREVGGYSYDQIGEMIEADESTVRGLISRARVSLRTNREAQSLDCGDVQLMLAGELDGRRRNATVRRHMRACDSCMSYARALRADQVALQGLVPALPLVAALGSGGLWAWISRPRTSAVAAIAAGNSSLIAKVVTVGAVSILATGSVVAVEREQGTNLLGLGSGNSAQEVAIIAPPQQSYQQTGASSGGVGVDSDGTWHVSDSVATPVSSGGDITDQTGAALLINDPSTASVGGDAGIDTGTGTGTGTSATGSDSAGSTGATDSTGTTAHTTTTSDSTAASQSQYLYNTYAETGEKPLKTEDGTLGDQSDSSASSLGTLSSDSSSSSSSSESSVGDGEGDQRCSGSGCATDDDTYEETGVKHPKPEGGTL